MSAATKHLPALPFLVAGAQAAGLPHTESELAEFLERCVYVDPGEDLADDALADRALALLKRSQGDTEAAPTPTDSPQRSAGVPLETWQAWKAETRKALGSTLERGSSPLRRLSEADLEQAVETALALAVLPVDGDRVQRRNRERLIDRRSGVFADGAARMLTLWAERASGADMPAAYLRRVLSTARDEAAGKAVQDHADIKRLAREAHDAEQRQDVALERLSKAMPAEVDAAGRPVDVQPGAWSSWLAALEVRTRSMPALAGADPEQRVELLSLALRACLDPIHVAHCGNPRTPSAGLHEALRVSQAQGQYDLAPQAATLLGRILDPPGGHSPPLVAALAKLRGRVEAHELTGTRLDYRLADSERAMLAEMAAGVPA